MLLGTRRSKSNGSRASCERGGKADITLNRRKGRLIERSVICLFVYFDCSNERRRRKEVRRMKEGSKEMKAREGGGGGGRMKPEEKDERERGGRNLWWIDCGTQ